VHSVYSSVQLFFAQTIIKSPFSDSLVSEFCHSFSNASIENKNGSATAELGLMILPLFTKYKQQISKEWGYDIENSQDLQKASEKIGQLAAVGCPKFMDFVKANLDEFRGNGNSSKTFTGKVLKVEGKPFSYLLVQNKAGKIDKIYWMEFFEGAALIQSGNIFLNKPVAIKFKEVEMYDALSKEYRNIKVATKLELN
jgi:hypothetical protein